MITCSADLYFLICTAKFEIPAYRQAGEYRNPKQILSSNFEILNLLQLFWSFSF